MEYLKDVLLAFFYAFFVITLPFTLVPLIFFGAAAITIVLSNETVQMVLGVLFVIGSVITISCLDSQEEYRRNGLWE